MSKTLAKVLAVMGYEEDEIEITKRVIGSMRRIMMIKKETLLANSEISPGMVDELLCFKRWYMQWRKTGGKDTLIEDTCTEDIWDDFVMEEYDEEMEDARKAKED
eukprot:11231687-Ditylum_brightwellii.AAC.1